MATKYLTRFAGVALALLVLLDTASAEIVLTPEQHAASLLSAEQGAELADIKAAQEFERWLDRVRSQCDHEDNSKENADECLLQHLFAMDWLYSVTKDSAVGAAIADECWSLFQPDTRSVKRCFQKIRPAPSFDRTR